MPGELPLAVKIAYTAMVALIVPVYAARYGAANFLWFSDIALLVTVVALWWESALLASMMALAVLLPEVLWNASFFGRLLFGLPISDLAGYMFDARKSRFLRGLSLFHVVLPPLLVWMVSELGYDPRALAAQTILAWVVLPLTYAVNPAENINWVFGPGATPQRRIPPLVYLVALMVFFPLVVYLPTHAALRALFGAR